MPYTSADRARLGRGLRTALAISALMWSVTIAAGVAAATVSLWLVPAAIATVAVSFAVSLTEYAERQPVARR
jgi:uncharacterized membrane protein